MPRQRKTAGAFVVWKSDQAGAQKKGQGAMPLAGCRVGAPAGVWGNAPTVPRQTNSKGTAHKGAGSEASLPLTSRVLRRAPQAALSNNCAVSHQMGATEKLFFPIILGFSRSAGISPLRRRVGGFAIAPDTPSQRTPMLLDFYRGFLIMTLLFPEQRNCNPWRA